MFTNDSKSIIRTTVDKDGNQLTRTRTLMFPVAFRDERDAEWLMKVASVTKDTMNLVLGILRDRFFEPIQVTVGGEPKSITLFDLFDKKSGVKAPFTVGDKTTNNGGTMSTYTVREIFNPKCPLAGHTIDEFIDHMNSLLQVESAVDKTFIKESIFMRVQGAVIGAVDKKLNRVKGNAKKDRTWSTCCRDAARKHAGTDLDAAVLARQIETFGVNIHADLHNPPTVKKWPEKCSVKVGGTSYPVKQPETDEAFMEAYCDAIAMFKEAFKEAFPEIRRQALLFCPGIQLDWDSRDLGKFYDLPGKLTNIPAREKRKGIQVMLRTVSGHSKNYYPEDMKSVLKDVPAFSIRFGADMTPGSVSSIDGMRKTEKVVLGHVAANLPKVETAFNEEGIDESEGVGIDVNEASFLMNTTVKLSETNGAVDWVEAIAAFRKDYPTAYPFTKASARVIREMNDIADSVTESDRLLRVIPLVGLRDGKPADEKHGWKASPDPLVTFFAWLSKRKDEEGNPFYTQDQLSHIGHTRDYRNLVREETANHLHYFDEQSKWDLTHDGKVDPFSESAYGKELLAEREDLRERIEKEFSRLAVTGLLGIVNEGRIQYVKMEDVDLSEIKNERQAKTLWGTARSEWGMCDGKLSCNGGNVEFVTECGFNIDAVKSTEFWRVKDVKREGDTVKVVAEPTEKYVELNARFWVDAYTKRALHLSSIKAIVEELCFKRGIHFTLIDPAYTSKLCHVCRSAEQVNRKGSSTEKLGIEECMTHRVNFRNGRTFVCGNPECSMCGKVQNADDNAAVNILLPEISEKIKRAIRRAA